MESTVHRELKTAAAAWLQADGAAGVAHEVTTPIPLWRADVAGWMVGAPRGVERLSRADAQRMRHPPAADALPWPGTDPVHELLRQAGATNLFQQPDLRPDAATVRRVAARVHTVIVECKASRADFLSDRADLDRSTASHQRLRERRDTMREHLVPRWEPHLRRHGETLFEQTDGWDYERSRLASVRAAERDERLARRTLRQGVKFDRLARWRLADWLLLCCPGGLIRPIEVPPGWGLLEVTRGAVRLRVMPSSLQSPPPRRWRLVMGVRRAARIAP
ncbi:MAG: hypothetical protein RLZZ558_539 [Planctomycetota bacterium]|jgi:hypothetical protein